MRFGDYLEFILQDKQHDHDSRQYLLWKFLSFWGTGFDKQWNLHTKPSVGERLRFFDSTDPYGFAKQHRVLAGHDLSGRLFLVWGRYLEKSRFL
ncbi:MAG: hypothetical protein EBQ67_06020 [Sphingobacteriia bacterium]|nr:hypothetical protein [Sphingobacteriia bacterium]